MSPEEWYAGFWWTSITQLPPHEKFPLPVHAELQSEAETSSDGCSFAQMHVFPFCRAAYWYPVELHDFTHLRVRCHYNRFILLHLMSNATFTLPNLLCYLLLRGVSVGFPDWASYEMLNLIWCVRCRDEGSVHNGSWGRERKRSIRVTALNVFNKKSNESYLLTKLWSFRGKGGCGIGKLKEDCPFKVEPVAAYIWPITPVFGLKIESKRMW